MAPPSGENLYENSINVKNTVEIHSINVQVSCYKGSYHFILVIIEGNVLRYNTIRWCVILNGKMLFQRGKKNLLFTINVLHTCFGPNRTAFFNYTGGYDGLRLFRR